MTTIVEVTQLIFTVEVIESNGQSVTVQNETTTVEVIESPAIIVEIPPSPGTIIEISADGPPGPPGQQGQQGDQGDVGPQGAQGDQGIQGVQGVEGDKGDGGDKGDKGDLGVGFNLRGPWAPLVTYAVNDVVDDAGTSYAAIVAHTSTGPDRPPFPSLWALIAKVGNDGADGADGADGNSVLSANGSPADVFGNDGDFYINLLTYDIFGPKASGMWPTPPTSLIGPPGATGAQGIQGIQGIPGADGADGADGNTILSGTGDPIPATGVFGDYYIDTDADVLWGPKVAGSLWVGTDISLVGPAGDAGRFTIGAAFFGGGIDIQVGSTFSIRAEKAFTIEGVYVTTEDGTPGDIQIDIWVDDFAGFPPDNADSITAGNEPNLSNQEKSFDNALNGWSLVVNSGDWLRFNVDSVAGVKQATILLVGSKN